MSSKPFIYRKKLRKNWMDKIVDYFCSFFTKSYTKEQTLAGVEFISVKKPTAEQIKDYYNRVKNGESLASIKDEHLDKYSTTVSFGKSDESQ